jgi:dipeptidase D
MTNPLAALDPEPVWRYFARISSIPRSSGHEAALAEAICAWARSSGCKTRTDEVGNLVVQVPATAGCDGAPTVVLQCHLDMVCEKNADTIFDFLRDSIALECEGDWVTAAGTTLGADNGIGLASALALMDLPGAVHGPLEILMTVDEESGLVGAQGLSSDLISGRILLNLDSEEDGVFYVGCAGGRDSTLSLKIDAISAAADQVAYALKIKGLRGGHSGLDIIRNRGNAVCLLARALGVLDQGAEIALAELVGGDKHNAIPREGRAVFAVAKDKAETVQRLVDNVFNQFKEQFADEDPGLSLALEPVPVPAKVLTRDATRQALNLLLGLPSGVIAMMCEMPGVVETSTNLARARISAAGVLEILCSTRSAVKPALDGVVSQIRAVADAMGATVVVDEGYPGWKPDMNSNLRARVADAWAGIYGDEPSFQVIHAGLECGIIGEKFTDMDMISMGPTILHAHSPDEKVSIRSVARFFGFLQVLLAALVTP